MSTNHVNQHKESSNFGLAKIHNSLLCDCKDLVQKNSTAVYFYISVTSFSIAFEL